MTAHSPFLTVDSNIIISALRRSEPSSKKCGEILTTVQDQFILVEPSIIYQEVCGTIARKADLKTANDAKEHLDTAIDPKRVVSCDKKTCVSAFRLCAEHNIYAIDALYLHVALTYGAVLVSLDKEFIKGLNRDRLPIEAYTVETFPY